MLNFAVFQKVERFSAARIPAFYKQAARSILASLTQGILRALGRLGVVALSATLFVVGIGAAVYLSLRSPEVNVPKVVGNDRFSAEDALGQAGLNMRVRASRYSPNAKADTILDQNPRAGETVKAGQTIAVVVSRTQAREGEEAIAQAELEESAAAEAAAAEEADSGVNANRQNTNANRAVSVLARTNANNRANRNTNANNSNKSNNNNSNNANNTTNSNNSNVNQATNAANTNGANNANRLNANTGNVNRNAANNANRNSASNTNANRNAVNRNSNNRNAANRNANNRTPASPANRNTRP